MKIQIVGYSGSGKSTFAAKLSDFYNIPLLHMDRVNFLPNWISKDKEIVVEEVENFIKNDSWVIDGNYREIITQRFDLADTIFFFNFNRIKCLYGAIKRRIKYRNKVRESAPDGCKEQISLEFFMWIIYSGRKKQRRCFYKKLMKTNKVVVFKNRRQVNKYLNSIGIK